MLNGQDSRTRILIVEEQMILREGMKLLVSQEPDFMVCGEVESVRDALGAVERLRPDVFIIAMKEARNLELIKDVRCAYPQVRILVLAMRYELFLAERVLRAGAMGLIAKEDGTVIEGIRKILSGQIYVSEKLASMIIRTFAGAQPGTLLMGSLTDRELEVFELIGQGLSRREIAQRLHLSVKTIGSHREHIKEKLKLATSAALLKHAIEWTQMPLTHAGEASGWATDGEASQGDDPFGRMAASGRMAPVARRSRRCRRAPVAAGRGGPGVGNALMVESARARGKSRLPKP